MHEAVAEDDRTQRELLRRSLRDKRASLAHGLVRAMSADVCAAVAALHFAHFLIDQGGERLHVRLFGVTFDRVVLAGDRHCDGPFHGWRGLALGL